MTSTPPPTSGDSTPAGTGPADRPDAAPMTAWIARATAALDLPADAVPVPLLLDLARDAAHGVARPAAPLTTFVAGLAAGRAGATPEATAAAVARLTELLGESG